MITLKVEEYCHECPAFEPDVDTSGWYNPLNQEEMIRETVILCRYRKRCASMMRYLKKQMREDAASD